MRKKQILRDKERQRGQGRQRKTLAKNGETEAQKRQRKTLRNKGRQMEPMGKRSKEKERIESKWHRTLAFHCMLLYMFDKCGRLSPFGLAVRPGAYFFSKRKYYQSRWYLGPSNRYPNHLKAWMPMITSARLSLPIVAQAG